MSLDSIIQKARRLNIATHRDLGYFFSGLVVIYCLSGIALNHVDEWNPDFIIQKKTVRFTGHYSAKEISAGQLADFNKMVGEEKYKVFDAPTADQVKIYYDNASLHLNFAERKGIYEKITRRPLFYHMNVLHKNNVKGWKWASDVLAGMLLLITGTGLFILKGKKGLSGRGKWLILAGLMPPLIAWIVHAFV